MKKRYFIWTHDRERNLLDDINNMELVNLIVEQTKIINGVIIEIDDADRISHARKYCREHGLMMLRDRDQYLQDENSLRDYT